MAIAFTYTESTNKAVQTGGTSGTPAVLNDFVHADRTVATTACSVASGAELKAATAVANPTTLNLTYPMRPVEFKALRLAITTAQAGGAAVSGDETVDIYGTTATWCKLTGASASGQKVVPIADLTHLFQVGDTVALIDISAPSTYETDVIASISEGVSITLTNNNTNSYAIDDIVGIYQTEQIDVSAAFGTYWTTVPYGQIAELIFTGFDGTNTAKVDQPIWGVIWDRRPQFRIDGNLDIGDGSTATYMLWSREDVHVKNCAVEVAKYGTHIVGAAFGDYAKNGCSVRWDIDTGTAPNWTKYVSGPTLEVYGSLISFEYYGVNIKAGSFTNKNNIFSGTYSNGVGTSSLKQFIVGSSVSSGDWADVYAADLYGFTVSAPNLTIENFTVIGCRYGGLITSSYPLEYNKYLFDDSVLADSYLNLVGMIIFLNPIKDPSTWVNVKAASTQAIARTINIFVIGPGGDPEEGAKIIVKDVAGNIVSYADSGETITEVVETGETDVNCSDGTVFAAGNIIRIAYDYWEIDSIATDTLTVDRVGYTTPSDDGYQGSGYHATASVIYIVGGVLTGADGKIAEQKILYTQRFNTDEGVTDYFPITVEISKAGMLTQTIPDPFDNAIDWTIKLKPLPYPTDGLRHNV